MNYFLLIGIAIIIIGFALKLDSIGVVIFAAIVTALIGGQNFIQILEVLGKQFVSARYMSLFFLTLPVVGISERYGLRERAVILIQKMGNLTSGRLLTGYLVVRELASAFSLRIGGHAQFIRPLVEPMAQAAAKKDNKISEELEDEIKGAAGAVENYGNFFAQNIFAASAGVLLIQGTLSAQKINVQATDLALWSIPIAVIALVVGTIQFKMLDNKVKKQVRKDGE